MGVSSRPSGVIAKLGRPFAGTPAVLAVPAVAVALLMLLPLAYLIVRALGAGIDALHLAFSFRTFQLLLQTSALAATVTLAAVAIGLPVAWLTARTDLPGRGVLGILLVLPLVVPSYVGALAYIAAAGPRGLLQQALATMIGVERLPAIYGFWGAAAVLTLFSYPYVVLSVRGALQRLDPSLDQASRSLGVGPVATFFRVTLPILRPALTAGALLVALYTLSDFGAVSLLQFDSFTRAIYLQYQGSLDRTMAAVLSLILVGVAAIVLAVEARTRGRARYHRLAAGAQAAPGLIRLGHLRWAGLAFCLVVLLLAVILPLSILVYWLGRGLAAGTSFGPVWTALGNSIYASALAAGASLACAFPVAILAVRYPGRLSALIERVTYLAFALPGIVIALALVFFGANYAQALYQTLALLVLAYVIRFLPEAVGSVRTGLLQVSPRLEEAARSLGSGPLRVLVRVTAPLVWPGAMAGAALVFMSTMKELPVTLLLAPIGFRTLATTSWSYATEGFFAQAALPALLLVAASAASLPLLLRQEKRQETEQTHE
jgi:iron(III) transport system permease protein